VCPYLAWGATVLVIMCWFHKLFEELYSQTSLNSLPELYPPKTIMDEFDAGFRQAECQRLGEGLKAGVRSEDH